MAALKGLFNLFRYCQLDMIYFFRQIIIGLLLARDFYFNEFEVHFGEFVECKRAVGLMHDREKQACARLNNF